LTHPVAEAFVESKISKPAMWITQSVRLVLYRQRVREFKVISGAFPAPKDNPISNCMFSWATSRYEERLIRFTLNARLDALASPQKINFWNHGTTKSRCPFCAEIGATTRHIQCNCNVRGKDSLVMKEHNRVGCVIAEAAKKCHKRNLQISEDKRIEHVCHLHNGATQKSVRPDLVWESSDKEGNFGWKFIGITCPWAWIDHDG
jgi:hypothetical protein